MASAAALLSGCLDEPVALQIRDCEPAYGLEPDCRFWAPQDLSALPGTAALIASQPGIAGAGGELVLYRPLDAFAADPRGSDSVQVLYPGNAFVAETGWGEPGCPAPEPLQFSPRGIDAVVRHDGRTALLVVNQGARRSIEFFEVITGATNSDGAGPPAAAEAVSLTWRGCVPAPGTASFGDIAADPTGGFWVTQVFPRKRPFWSYLKARVGFSTGYVYRWAVGGDFDRVEGTEARMPSGIALGRDRNHLYFGTYLGDAVRKFDVARGEVVAEAQILQPTKMNWARDGRLLVASHTAGFLERGQCDPDPAGACGFSFEIVSIETGSMDAFVVLSHQGPPIGGVDVATHVDDSLYLASPLGDRIVRYRLDQSAAEVSAAVGGGHGVAADLLSRRSAVTVKEPRKNNFPFSGVETPVWQGARSVDSSLFARRATPPDGMDRWSKKRSYFFAALKPTGPVGQR